MSDPVTKIDLPYVKRYPDRHGRVRHYYRRRGYASVPLPGVPGSPEFLAAYQKARTSKEASARGAADRPGSFNALIKEYLQSAEFGRLKPRTRAEYRRVLEKFAQAHGDLPVDRIERKHVHKLRDQIADTPGAANTLVRMLALLLTFAVERGYRGDNPAARIKPLKTGEWRAWSDHELEAFRQRWPMGTMERRAFSLALYTTQRKSDLVKMTQAHRRDGWITVVQEKTGEHVEIPEHDALAAELAADPPKHLALLTTPSGKAFTPEHFGKWFAKAIEAAGLPDECVLHGLRKSGCVMLAEAGCSAEEIKAISGHRSDQMVSKYTKAASKRRLADSAMARFRNGA